MPNFNKSDRPAKKRWNADERAARTGDQLLDDLAAL